MFWKISRIYFFFFSIQKIKKNCYVIFLKFSAIIFFWLKISFVPVIFIIKVLIFVILCRSFFLSLHNLSWMLTYLLSFFDWIYCCHFVFYPIRRIYIWSTTIPIYFMTFKIQQMNIIKDKFTTFTDFKSFWYLFSSESKNFITSSTSSLIMISMLSLFECTTCSSSLPMEEIKLFAIVNWVFHVPKFLRLFMMSFKYGLILLRYSSTDGVLFLPLLLSYSI